MSGSALVFEEAEFAERLARAQALMVEEGFAALLVSTEPEVRYFSGFLTRFWESPARPWFVIVPAVGKPVAVIPSIGAPLMARCWIDDIRTWTSPDPDDEGVSLLASSLIEIVPPDGRIGVPMGPETHLRMPLADWHRLKSQLHGRTLDSDDGLMRRLRMVKSEAEIGKIRTACGIADRAFARVPEIAHSGVPLAEVFRRFQILCLEEGADWVPYLAGASAQTGYGDVISPATADPLQPGDILMLDTGVIFHGYFSDFDRNFSVGPATDAVRNAHVQLIDAVDAGAEAARPGALASDVFKAMNRLLTGGDEDGQAGRLGHGLGMQLTEWPSLSSKDRTVIAENMVLTLEPGIETAPGRFLVHEENIVVRADGAEFLSRRHGRDMIELEPGL